MLKLVISAAVVGIGLGVGTAMLDVPAVYKAIGRNPSPERIAAGKPGNHVDGEFQNLVPAETLTDLWGTLQHQFFGPEQHRTPSKPVPVHYPKGAELAVRGPDHLRAVWIGHASVLLQIDGHHVLTDPVWSDRASPSKDFGPKRFFPPPIPLAELPPIDAIVISHDHYDHLDQSTVVALAKKGTSFVVPLGIGAHLEAWGVDPKRIVELTWHGNTRVKGLTLTSTPAQHYSGRLFTRNPTLWSSWVIAGPKHRVFFSGDTGYFDEFKRIGVRYGPFDLTLIKIGAYGPTWLPIHMSAEDAVRTHLDVKGRLLLPVHWATFNLAFHDWNEPAVLALKAAQASRARITFPIPGAIVDVEKAPYVAEWWK